MQTIFSLCGFSFRPPAKKLRGWKPRTGVLHPDERDVTIEPERRRRATRLAQGELTKHEFRIKLHAVFPQQRKKLLLKTHFPVMRFLILYISHHHWNNRRAHAKRRVPLLPRELVTFFVCPPRRIRFDRANRLG